MRTDPHFPVIALGGGCFWCLEAVFRRLHGVRAVESGFSNGQGGTPSYEQVCSGATGHVEVVRVQYDPDALPLALLLKVFFEIHDPTSLNRQGADVGTQYRSGIYYTDDAQRLVAQEALADAQAAHGGRVVTELLPLTGYVKAEEGHQRYFERNRQAGYCAYVVLPKVEHFRQAFADHVRDAA